MFAGLHELTVTDADQALTFPALVFFPADQPSADERVGPYTLDVSRDAPIAEGCFPLVAVSHGGGGWHLVYRDLCCHLARQGYCVVAPEHPGNNRNDNRLNGTDLNLRNRPRHVSLALDAVASSDRFRHSVQAENVAIIGHSMGGYTALAMAGGTPWNQERQPIEVTVDQRVRSLVLLAPATAFYFPEDALREVRQPILLLYAEHDPLTPPWQAELVPDPGLVSCRMVENAGHFSFLSPFPPEMLRPGFPPATDPEGFDRERFQAELRQEVTAFLDRTLRIEGH